MYKNYGWLHMSTFSSRSVLRKAEQVVSKLVQKLVTKLVKKKLGGTREYKSRKMETFLRLKCSCARSLRNVLAQESALGET